MRETYALIALAALLLLSCTVDEDLRVNSDGSGSYRARISVPKPFAEGFADLRKEATKNGFTVVEEGENDRERFFVISKDFADIEALNDSHTHFELTMTNTGFLRREYRLRAVLKAIAYGSFKRRFTVAMPGKVLSATDGEITGAGVRWEGSTGGSFEVVSSGFYLPLGAGQRTAVLVAIAVLLLFLVLRRRRQSSAAFCPTCSAALRAGARFCGICGADTPIAQA